MENKIPTIQITEDMPFGLVGMWASILNGDKRKFNVFIYAQLSEEYYLAQVVCPLSGAPNIAKIFHIKDMLDWVFYPNKGIYEWITDEYYKKGSFDRNFFANTAKYVDTKQS